MFPFLLVILLLLFVALPIGVAYAAQLFEHYNPSTYGSGLNVVEKRWVAQTFTAESAHPVISVKLPIERRGDPGDVTVSIQGTDGSGHPDGTELASETIAGSTLPGGGGVWAEISFTTPCDLTEGQKYAIVACAPYSDYMANKYVVWWLGNGYGGGAYDGGNTEESSNSGSTWSSNLTNDLQFEVYGPSAPPPPPAVGGEVYPVNKITLVVPWITLAAAIIAGGVFLITRKAYR